MKFINNVKKSSLVVTLCFIPLLFTAFHPIKRSGSPPKMSFTVVIDPGHGGNKPGARGRQSAEKDIVLDVSKKLKKMLEDSIPDIQVILTRSTDVDVEFYKRTDIANKNHADLFISIHANSADRDIRVKNRQGRYVNSVKRNPGVKGTETLVLGFHRINEQDVAIRENADILLEDNYEENYHGFDPKDPSSYIVFKLMKRQFRDQSIKLASLMQHEYIKSSRGSRGVKEQGLAVLAKAGMPAVLTEIGFISSPEEEAYMLSQTGQQEIVTNLFYAIKTFKTANKK
ncbi:N-acetylmuramoyl-L-alanine amidase family protein [Sphingobacterium pedocola]|uniref:N-acetylmuramoyl-L-alanine amidase n=1 Tax=Sphingobacterium pedocola TaxID=2082722 RepID=A0ABR9TCZ5_9SPHI|nr:N-acetylmuramoyl-L-alanine amidase [Sphingobacterium pedocola]MBE8723233.1 N-acetylmuramoyl-L-alanine amidase [Sphingobacterium pedocola]